MNCITPNSMLRLGWFDKSLDRSPGALRQFSINASGVLILRAFQKSK